MAASISSNQNFSTVSFISLATPNKGARPLPYNWAQHERIAMPVQQPSAGRELALSSGQEIIGAISDEKITKQLQAFLYHCFKLKGVGTQEIVPKHITATKGTTENQQYNEPHHNKVIRFGINKVSHWLKYGVTATDRGIRNRGQ